MPYCVACVVHRESLGCLWQEAYFLPRILPCHFFLTVFFKVMFNRLCKRGTILIAYLALYKCSQEKEIMKKIASFSGQSLRAITPLRLSMCHRPLMLWLNLPVVDVIHPQSNKFVTGVKIKATGESRLNDGPQFYCYYSRLTFS